MGKDKKVGDSTFVTDIDEDVSVIGKPDVAKNPMTGELERILDIIVTDMRTYCPSCKKENGPGIEITVTETGLPKSQKNLKNRKIEKFPLGGGPQ